MYEQLTLKSNQIEFESSPIEGHACVFHLFESGHSGELLWFKKFNDSFNCIRQIDSWQLTVRQIDHIRICFKQKLSSQKLVKS